MKSSSKIKWFSLFSLATIAVLVWVTVGNEVPTGFLKIFFLDVGQGDAIFIETPNHNQILIDGGAGSNILSQIGEVMPFYDREIDLVISTHPDHDHLGGLIEVLQRYKVNMVLTTGVKTDTKEFSVWQEILNNNNINVQIAKAGQEIKLSKDASLFVLWPLDDLQGQNPKDLNNTSIINRLVYGNFEVLFTGDAEEYSEEMLLEKDFEVQSDVLKVGHHGSKSSTSEKFLKEVSPEVAVIQVGKDNRYRHPHEEVLDRLKNIQIYRTDEHGRIEIESDGKDYKIKTQK